MKLDCPVLFAFCGLNQFEKQQLWLPPVIIQSFIKFHFSVLEMARVQLE